MKVGEYRTVMNVIVVADVRGAAESVYLGATRSDEVRFSTGVGPPIRILYLWPI